MLHLGHKYCLYNSDFYLLSLSRQGYIDLFKQLRLGLVRVRVYATARNLDPASCTLEFGGQPPNLTFGMLPPATGYQT